MTELHPVIYDLVPSVANTIYRRYKNYVERDDIKQECMAWAMTRANRSQRRFNGAYRGATQT
jgi:hypothetical protein